jgi:acetyltransferase-like isoleucine patch superfamily enzyme
LRNLTIIQTKPGESSAAWIKKKSRIRVLVNWMLLQAGEMIPFTQKKQFFYRLMGVKIGKNVQIMPNVFFDIFFPEMITIGDNVVIGIGCFIACHEFNPTEFRYGPITLKKDSLLGARSFVLPGVIIGENSLVGAQTVVHKDVPDNMIAFGSPLQFKPKEVHDGLPSTKPVKVSAQEVRNVVKDAFKVNPAKREEEIEANLASHAELNSPISAPKSIQELQKQNK